jgi:membrane protein
LSGFREKMRGAASSFGAWKRDAAALWKDFALHEGSQAAAAFAFFALLSLFALLNLASGIMGMALKNRPDLLRRAVDYVVSHAPGVSELVEEALDTSADFGGLLGVIGFLGLLLTGTKVTDSLQVWLNRIWGLEKPSFLRRKSKGLVIMLVAALAVFLGLFLHVILVYAAGKIGGLKIPLSLLAFLGAVSVQGAGLAFTFAFATETRLGVREVWRGAFAAALLINPLLLLLAWYYTHMGDLAAVYGSFAGVVLGILTIYYAAYVIYLGAELNRFLYERRKAA